MKRKRAEEEVSTPSKKRSRATLEKDRTSPSPNGISEDEIATPSKPQSTKRSAVNGTPRKTPRKGINGATLSGVNHVEVETPTRTAIPDSEDEEDDLNAGGVVHNADKSAKRKSARRLIERTMEDRGSDDEASEEEDLLAQQIWEEDERQGVEGAEGDEIPQEPETPSKRRPGRPRKATKEKKEETPPPDMPPHERYFWDHRPGGGKTSNNTLPAHLLLNHDEYFEEMQSYVDPHQAEIDKLQTLHEDSFEQWTFELEMGFNLCLHGYGSKCKVIESLAEYLYDNSAAKSPKIVIANGYDPSVNLRHILTALASNIFPSQLKIPTQPALLQQLILDTLIEKPPAEPLYLLINSLDAQPLRRLPTQMSIATLAAHTSIRIVATCDTLSFPLLWDVNLRRQFGWVFHDTTTFAAYEREIDVVESVNQLLGRSSRRIGGRDGVGYVLRSLPENARNLYRILVAEQLAANAEGEEGGAAPDEEGIEYRILYHKAREELVCSTEHQFRTLLKEFYDHQMIESRRDAVGTERLVVPFRAEELEGLLEDLVE